MAGCETDPVLYWRTHRRTGPGGGGGGGEGGGSPPPPPRAAPQPPQILGNSDFLDSF